MIMQDHCSVILATSNKKERKGHWRGMSYNLWHSLPRCSEGDKENTKNLGRWQCFNNQVTFFFSRPCLSMFFIKREKKRYKQARLQKGAGLTNQVTSDGRIKQVPPLLLVETIGHHQCWIWQSQRVSQTAVRPNPCSPTHQLQNISQSNLGLVWLPRGKTSTTIANSYNGYKTSLIWKAHAENKC